MAIGTTSTYAQTRDNCIGDSLVKVGALGPNGTPNGDMLAHGARAFGDLAKSLDAEGANLWKMIRRSFTLTSGTASATPASDVDDIEGPLSYLPTSSTGRSLLSPISREDYMSITDRTVSGRPTLYYVERVVSGAAQTQLTVYLWPVPDTTSDTIEYTAVLRRLDFTDGGTHPDFPSRWLKCLKLGLAATFALDYGSQLQLCGMLEQQFQAEKAMLMGSDSERGALILVPFGTGGY